MTVFCDMKGKLRLDLVPPEVEESFAQVSEFGIEKLTKNNVENPDHNWLKGLNLDKDHITKARRHINKWRKGIDKDEESGLNHLKHALWHLGAAITQIERGRIDLDDRLIKQKQQYPKNTQAAKIHENYEAQKNKDSGIARYDILKGWEL